MRAVALAGFFGLLASCHKESAPAPKTGVSVIVNDLTTQLPAVNAPVELFEWPSNAPFLMAGTTDANGFVSFPAFTAADGHTYYVHTAYGSCKDESAVVTTGRNATYQLNAAPGGRLYVHVANHPSTGDSLNIEYVHKREAFLQGQAWQCLARVNYSSNKNDTSWIMYSGTYYVTISKLKSGVQSVLYDTITVPPPV